MLFNLISTVPEIEELLFGDNLTFVIVLLAILKLIISWVCHLAPQFSTLINFAAKFVTFPLLIVRFQSLERTNLVAADRLEGLIVPLMGFCVTKISELISPLAEKVFMEDVSDAVITVVFPFIFVLLEVAVALDV